MNAKILTVVIGLMFLLPAGYAASYKFGNCPSDPDDPNDDDPYYSEYFNGSSSDPYDYRYKECAPDGEPFPPDLVTGHTVYAKWVIEDVNINDNVLGLPTDFAAVAGYFVDVDINIDVNAKQRECVVWFNGQNLDQQPDPDNFDATNDFPSDEDIGPAPSGSATGHTDSSAQDYDFDRDVMGCGPEEYTLNNATYQYGDFAVAVEKGDCNPGEGTNFRYRAHLDFVDPNGQYHEVQEYDYNCLLDIVGEAMLCDDYRAVDATTKESTQQSAESPPYPDPDNTNTTDPTNPNNTTTSGAGFGGADPQTRNSNRYGYGHGDEGVGGCASEYGTFLGFNGALVSDAVGDLFPWTYTDPHNQNGCDVYNDSHVRTENNPDGPNDPYANPEQGTGADGHPEGGATVQNETVHQGTGYGDGSSNNTTTTAHVDSDPWVDLGHKCNGTIQDLFKERLWITRVHAPVLDPTIGDYYTFALMVDTCAGINIFELGGKQAISGSDPSTGYEYPKLPGTGGRPDGVYAHDQSPYGGNGGDYYNHQVPFTNQNVNGYDIWYDVGVGGNFPLDSCTDGSSFSFDDTNRGLARHEQRPGSLEEVMRGNSFSQETGAHRQDCREDWSGAPYNQPDGGWPANYNPPGTDQASCYPEDHKTAAIDLYVFDYDPTGLFEVHNTTADTFANSTDYDLEINGVCVHDSDHTAHDDQYPSPGTHGRDGYHDVYPCEGDTNIEPDQTYNGHTQGNQTW